jgi:1,4-alpha-glucan branching enzyme
VIGETPDGARVRIDLPAPESGLAVAVLGDFTLWEEVPMQRRDGHWSVELDIPVGTHHFGFLVDDEWYIPDEAPDVVPDEWGRRSLTLVVGAGEP